jgi:hypothetical protein
MTHIPVFVIVPVIAVLMGAISMTLVPYAFAQQSGYNLTVIVTSHAFGMVSVSIDIQTENGYSQSQQVATAGGVMDVRHSSESRCMGSSMCW